MKVADRGTSDLKSKRVQHERVGQEALFSVRKTASEAADLCYNVDNCCLFLCLYSLFFWLKLI